VILSLNFATKREPQRKVDCNKKRTATKRELQQKENCNEKGTTTKKFFGIKAKPLSCKI
jgi:hypothetical protein